MKAQAQNIDTRPLFWFFLNEDSTLHQMPSIRDMKNADGDLDWDVV